MGGLAFLDFVLGLGARLDRRAVGVRREGLNFPSLLLFDEEVDRDLAAERILDEDATLG